MWRFRKIDYIIIILLVIGIISRVSANPKHYVIPIIVFGLVFLLYKFPPQRRKRSATKQPTRRRTNKRNFRVIQGNKKDDDDTPRYH